jgi:two-component system sensor histidine kinase DctS
VNAEPTPPHTASPGAANPQRSPLRSRRWLLWGVLVLLVALMLGVMVFLAREYEDGREQGMLERDASATAADIRAALVRNVQTIQSLHNMVPTPDSWTVLAFEVLVLHREMVRLEWRNNAGELIAHRNTPYQAEPFGHLTRTDALPDIRQACETARRLSGPAFSASYFWPMRDGMGMELMEMCLPLARAGSPSGFMVATYSLSGILEEYGDKDRLRDHGLAFTEADGTRLAVLHTVKDVRRVRRANALLDLPGHTLMLQMERPHLQQRTGFYGLFPNLLTAVVGALSLALLAVMAMLGRDMRRRQRAEHSLANELAFRNAMENSLVTGLRARDMQGRVTYVNPAFCQMVGFSAEELLGTGLPAPWWPPELVDEYQQRQAVRLAGQTLPREGYESMFQRKDGTRIPVLIIEAPLIDAQGMQTGFMSAILDMTEQRRVEDLNRASQERLQATARLATMGEMASLLSHELNQPLAAISSYATGTLNLLEEPLPEVPQADLLQAMRRIGEQADRAGRVIKSVADFVRRREQVREAVAPSSLVDAILPLLRLQAKKQDIRLQIGIAPDCPAVLCDRTMIEQVLLNLARNGMQAMPEGDPLPQSGLRVLTLQVAPMRQASANTRVSRPWVEFSVTDHGEGLSEEVQSKLFTPFFTTKSEGMGLGLNLCRTVVEQHGGVLVHATAQPRGTVFRFTLPGG